MLDKTVRRWVIADMDSIDAGEPQYHRGGNWPRFVADLEFAHKYRSDGMAMRMAREINSCGSRRHLIVVEVMVTIAPLASTVKEASDVSA